MGLVGWRGSWVGEWRKGVEGEVGAEVKEGENVRHHVAL